MAISLAEARSWSARRARLAELAADYAQRMLPQIFRPAIRCSKRRSAGDALGNRRPDGAATRRVRRRRQPSGGVPVLAGGPQEEVNRSEKKIGADELPAVTQLFTEDYMVLFPAYNTLGAWWQEKVLAAKPALARVGCERRRAARGLRGRRCRVDLRCASCVRRKLASRCRGTFDGGPKAARDITLLIL